MLSRLIADRLLTSSSNPRYPWTVRIQLPPLIIMSPRRQRDLRHWLTGGITDRVARLVHVRYCPLPTAANKFMARQIRALVFRLASSNNDSDLGPGALNIGSLCSKS